MRKVLLVDDEEFIRKGIRTILERADTVFKTIEECSDGAEALEWLEREAFDLVILDIQMPNLNGVEFMRRVQAKDRKPKVVVLSGYDEFQYAAESVRYGAKAYLLKPVSREELVGTLREVDAELVREEQIQSGFQKAGKILDEFKISKLNRMIQGVLPGDLPVGEVRQIFQLLELDSLGQEFTVACFYFDIKESTERRSALVRKWMDYLAASMETRFVNYPLKNGNEMLIAAGHPNFEAILRTFGTDAGDEPVVGASQLFSDWDRLQEACLQAQEALRGRMLMPGKSCIIFDETGSFRKAERVHGGRMSLESVMEEWIGKLAQMMGTDRSEEMEKVLMYLFNLQAIQSNGLTYLEGIAEEIYRQVILKYADSGRAGERQELFMDSAEKLRNPYNYRNLQEYVQHLKTWVLHVNGTLLEQTEVHRMKNEIERVLKFIHENCHRDIDLTMAANHMSYTYTYFSRWFTEKTGYTFVNYLRKVRIEKARELLKNTDMKVIQISEAVGFANPKHFTTTFRVLTGISPQEYKRKWGKAADK